MNAATFLALAAEQVPLPVPDPVPQPAPGWLLWFLLMLTFVLHLLAMNFVLGGSVVAAAARTFGNRSAGSDRARLFAWIGKAMPIGVAAAVTLGVAPLLFVQVLYGRLFFSSSVLMGWWWFAVVPLLLLGYGGAYLVAFRGERLRGAGTAIGWGIAALFGLIGFIYVNNMSLMLRASEFVPMYRADDGGTHLNLTDPTLLPRYLHMLLGAVAVGALIVAVAAWLRRDADPEHATWVMRHGASWFTVATGANLVVGVWFLIALPSATIARLMGGEPLASALLLLGIALGIGSFAAGQRAITAPEPAPWIGGAAALAALTVVLMALLRDQVRVAALDAIEWSGRAWVEPQWGVIALFLVLLVIALASVAWMVAAIARGPRVS